jgi:plastocyanin
MKRIDSMARPSFPSGFAFLVLVSVLAAIGAARPTGRAAVPDLKEVKIGNFRFTPQAITVPIGTRVRWTNGDDIPHTVVSEERVFKSKALDTDDQFTFTFTTPGTYKYFCSLHPRMTGTVVVQ